MAKKKGQQRISRAQGKAKARQLQQWVCRKISEVTGFEWGMAGDDKPIECRGMGQHGVDVRMERRVLRAFPFSVECKRTEAWAVPSWIEQAQTNQIEDTDWLVVAKRSRRDPVVILDAQRFFDLMSELRQARIQAGQPRRRTQ